MEVQEIHEPIPPLSEDEYDRSPGTHLTDVLKSAEQLLFQEKSVQTRSFGEPRCCMETGFLWERLLTLVFRSALGVRLGEVDLDGIAGSPDGIGDDPQDEFPFAVEEYKATWKSSRRRIEENWLYMAQAKSYCKMLGTQVCVFRVLYIVGDYRGSGPQYRKYRIRFTRRELEDNWRMVLNHKRWMEENGGL